MLITQKHHMVNWIVPTIISIKYMNDKRQVRSYKTIDTLEFILERRKGPSILLIFKYIS